MRTSIILLILIALAAPTSASEGDILVDTAWVAEHRGDANVRVVDMRDAGAYLAAHVPGAVQLPEKALVPLPTPGAFARLMGGMGIGRDTRVVIYDDSGGTRAARLWCVLRAYSHENASVVDGGWKKWVAENRATSDDAIDPTPAAFTSRATDLIWTTTDVIARPSDVVVLDVRTDEEFHGAKRSPGTLKAGRILGAVQAEQVTDDRPLLVYCANGGRAALAVLSLLKQGRSNVHLYYAGFADYTRSSVAPIEKD